MLIADALQLIHNSNQNGETFSLEWVTADQRRSEKASRIMRVNDLVESGSNHSNKDHGTITVMSVKTQQRYTVHTALIMKINSIFVQ